MMINQAIKKLRFNIWNGTPHKWGVYQALQTGLGMGVFQVLAFLSGILLARGLGSEGLGRFQLLLSIATFTIGLAKLGLDEGAAYLIPQYKIIQPVKVFSLIIYSLGISSLLSLFLGGIFYFASDFLEYYVFQLPGFASDLMFGLWLFPALMILLMSMSILRGLGRSDLRAYVYYYLVSLSFLGLVALFSIFGLTPLNAYAARIGSFGLGACVALAMILNTVRVSKWNLSSHEIKTLHSFGGLLIFVSLFQYVVEQPLIDLIIVGRVASASAVGIYAVAARVGVLVAIVANAFNIAVAPLLAASAAEKDLNKLTQQYIRASTWMMYLSLLAGITLLLLRIEALSLFGEVYRNGETVLVILILGQMVAGSLGLNTPLLLATGYARIEFILTGSFALLMGVSGLFLGQLYGPLGIAFATALSAILLAAARRVACFILFKVALPRQTLQILLIGCGAGAVGLLVQAGLLNKGTLGNVVAAVVFALLFLSASFVTKIFPDIYRIPWEPKH